MLSNEGVAIDLKKIETMVRWPVPKNKSDIRRFLGLATYMRKYIWKFVTIAATHDKFVKRQI